MVLYYILPYTSLINLLLHTCICYIIVADTAKPYISNA